MRARKITMLFLGFLGLMLATWIAVGQTRRVDDLALRNAGKTGEEWLTYGLTPGETRYSPLKQIDTDEREPARPVVVLRSRTGRRQPGSNAALWNGSIYAITNWSVVYAVDARTGKERWRWDPEVNQTAVRPKICCGVVNRGIAIYEGKIIAPVIDGRLVGARRRYRQTLVGSARRFSAGQLHRHHGAAHREGQGYRRSQRRRVSGSWILLRL